MRLYGIGGEILTTILAFILDYFQEKLFKQIFNKFFKKSKNSFGANWALFAQILSKMNFHGEEGFKYFNYLPSCQKSEETNEPFLTKMLELIDDHQRVSIVLRFHHF